MLLAHKSTSQSIETDTSELIVSSPAKVKKNNIWSMFSGNPGKAALFSGIIPGAGQLYNKTYWKIPLVLAIEGFAIGIYIQNNKTYRYWNNGLTQITNGDITSFETLTNPIDIANRKNYAEQLRDYALIAVIAIHFIQMSDAFISRHLIEFDVSDDLSMRIQPDASSLGINLALRF